MAIDWKKRYPRSVIDQVLVSNISDHTICSVQYILDLIEKKAPGASLSEIFLDQDFGYGSDPDIYRLIQRRSETDEEWATRLQTYIDADKKLKARNAQERKKRKETDKAALKRLIEANPELAKELLENQK